LCGTAGNFLTLLSSQLVSSGFTAILAAKLTEGDGCMVLLFFATQ
jgi:hypothetical protein